MSEGRIEVNQPRIVAFDIESTGTNPEKDRIVELCLATPGGRSVTFRVNPGVPIPPEATRVHGIRDEDVAHEPTFDHIAPKVQAWITGAVLLGYNSRSFDTPLLHHELRRAGQVGIDLDVVEEIDVMRIWSAIEPRSLSGAARRWLGEDHAGAHRAKDDVAVTQSVWERMRAAASLTHDDALRLTRPVNEVDRAGKFARNERDEVCYNFGKHIGKPVTAVDPAYLVWMSGADFPPSTKAVVEQLMVQEGQAGRDPR